MKSSRANQPLSLTFALALVVGLPLLLNGPPALAQSTLGQPMPLGPPPPPDAPDDQPPTFLKVVPSPLLEATPTPPAAASGHFEMEELKAPDMEAVGVLDDKRGGLGTGLWHGTPATLVRQFLPQLPAAPGSRTLRSLERRLLLTAAAAPEGGKGLTPPLLELRAERLFALGDVDGLAALLKAAPGALTSPGLSRIKIDTFLLAGDAKAACTEAATMASMGGAVDPRMQVFCLLTDGKVLEANMALDMMRERKDADHAFIAAAEAMGGTPPARVDKLPNPTPLTLAAFKAARMALPADAASSAPPALLRAMVDSPGLPVDVRLMAAERAEALGVLDTDSLRKFYGAITFTPEEQQAAMTQGDKTPRSRVLLLRAAGIEPVPAIRAELINRVLLASIERGALGGTARLYAPVIAELKPSPDLASFAPMLARALFVAGRPETAGAWVTLAKANPATAKAADDLWLLTRLGRAGGGDPAPAEAYAAWLGDRDVAPDRAGRRADMALEMLQAVGDKVPGAAWLALITHASPQTILTQAVLPFLPGDALKVAAAAGLAMGARRFRRQ